MCGVTRFSTNTPSHANEISGIQIENFMVTVHHRIWNKEY